MPNTQLQNANQLLSDPDSAIVVGRNMPDTLSQDVGWQKTQQVIFYCTLVLLFAVFFISRSHNIIWGDTLSLRGNEFDSYRDTATIYSHITAQHPFPLYYRVTQLLVGIFGYSDTVIRLFPYATTLLSFAVFFWLLDRRYSLTAATAWAVLLIFSPIHLLYSANARSYAISFFLTGLFCLILAEYFHRQRLDRRQIIGLCASGGLAVISHSSTIIPLGVSLVFFLLMTLCRKKLPVSVYAFMGVAMTSMALVALPILSRRLAAADFNLGRATLPIFGVVNEVGLPLFLFSTVYGAYLCAKHRRMDVLYFLGVIVLSFAAILLLGTLDPKVENRYLYVTLSCFFFIGAFCVEDLVARFKTRAEQTLMTVALSGVLVAANAFQLVDFYRDGDRYNYKAAVRYVEAKAGMEDLLLSSELPFVPDAPRLTMYTAHLPVRVFQKAEGKIRDETYAGLEDYLDTSRMCLKKGNLWYIMREGEAFCPEGDQTIFCRTSHKVKSIGIQRYDHHRWYLDIYKSDLPACQS
jgi:hypothetical protein